MKIELSDPFVDALEIVEAAKDFVSRMDFKECFSDDPKEFVAALSRIVLLEWVDIIVARHEGKIVGGIGMAYMPHTWNPDLLHAEELFWWTAPDAPGTTGMRILKAAMKHSKAKGAKIVTFRKLTSSPDKVASVYKRMGLKEIETTYSGLI